jgi:hypothetical protein
VALGLEALEQRAVPSVYFRPPADYAAGTGPSDLVAGDFRGLHTVDMATANITTNNVSVFLNKNDGTGTFQGAVNYPAGPAPIYLAAGDVTGDGYPDLVVANNVTPTGTVSVLLNDGTGCGRFLAPVPCNVGDGLPQAVALADVNGDGLLDIVTANFGAGPSGSVSVLLNDRTNPGHFLPAQTYPVGGTPYGLAVADFYGDGVPSIAVSDFSTGNILILRNNHDGTGTFRPCTTVGNVAGQVTGLAAGDLGNGAKDLVAADYTAGCVSVLLNNGTGTFAAPVTYAAGTHPISVAVADVNGDGFNDVVVANLGNDTDPGNVSVLLNSGAGAGAGTLLAAQNFAADNQPIAVAVADVNGDGLNDLLVANLASGDVSVLLQIPTAPAPPARPGSGGAAVQGPPTGGCWPAAGSCAGWGRGPGAAAAQQPPHHSPLTTDHAPLTGRAVQDALFGDTANVTAWQDLPAAP